MEILLAVSLHRQLRIRGTVVSNLEEAHEPLLAVRNCKIASIPLAVALETALSHKCQDPADWK